MVPRFAKPGKSFKGVMLYLTHDPDHAATSERVAWTHTLNLANDDVERATDEMHTTALNADILKAEHGIGGRRTERPVKHFSLNWHPSETPSQTEMIDTAKSFLKHMGWDKHQAVLLGHNDKEFHHVHVVVNAIHPETGRKLDDGFERRRAQQWALEYERSRGQEFCPQRSRAAADREAAEPRPAWIDIEDHSRRAVDAEVWGAAFAPSYMAREEIRRVIERHEWQILKGLQRDERLAFFEEGKSVYRQLNRAIYREVREEFRGEWASYYAAKRDGTDLSELSQLRAELIARQKSVLDERRDAVAAEKRAERDLEYRALLDAQKEERGELIDRQELGLRSPALLDRVYPHKDAGTPSRHSLEFESDALDRFQIGRGRSKRGHEEEAGQRVDVFSDRPRPGEDLFVPHATANPEKPPSRDIGVGLGTGILGLLGHLGDSLLGGHSKKPAKAAPQPDALARFGIQRGQPPPGDALERAHRENRQAYEDWVAWKEYHHLGQER